MVVEASCTPLLFAERNSTAPETPQPYPEYCWGCPSTTCHTSLRWCYSSGLERKYRARTSDRTLLSKTWWFPRTDSCGSTDQRNQISQERCISMGALTKKRSLRKTCHCSPVAMWWTTAPVFLQSGPAGEAPVPKGPLQGVVS